VLRQPIRIRLIEICTEWERISPKEIVDLRLCADLESIKGKNPQQALTNVAYHCRKLAEFGFLEVVATEPVRGATRHYYSATTEALFEGDDWSGLDEAQRQTLTQVAWQRFKATVDDSIQQEVFNVRTDRWLAWGPLDLDQQGWDELMKEISGTFDGIERIRRRAEARLKRSGEAPMRAAYGLLGFESPEREPRTLKSSVPHTDKRRRGT
jgi:hypothetical protein